MTTVRSDIKNMGDYLVIHDLGGKAYIPLLETDRQPRPLRAIFKRAKDAIHYRNRVRVRYEMFKYQASLIELAALEAQVAELDMRRSRWKEKLFQHFWSSLTKIKALLKRLLP